MAQVINSNNVGIVADALLMTIVERMDIFDQELGGGLASRNVNFNSSLFIPQFDLVGDSVRAWSADSVPDIVAAQTAASGETPTDVDYSEKELALTDLVYVIGDLIPNEWRQVWLEFAPDPEQPFSELVLNPAVQIAILTRMVQRRSAYDAGKVWTGDTGAGDPYDGLVTRIAASANTVNLFQTGDAAIDDTNITGYLKRLYDNVRTNKALKNHPNLKYVMSEQNLAYYEDAEIATSGKGPLNSQMAAIDNFRKVPIYTSQGFPDDTILLTYASTDMLNSTLHVGMKNATDSNEPVLGPYADGARKYWARLDYSMGTQITNDADIRYIQIP